jgi:hypothetical protein
MKYREWEEKAGRFVAITGYTVEKFGKLLSYFKATHDAYLAEYRMNDRGCKGFPAYTMYVGNPLPCMKERPIFILPYLKPNPIQEADADPFSMERKQTNRAISSFKVRTEHIGRSMKRSRTVRDECRLRKNLFIEKVFTTCAAPDNLRIKDGTFTSENNLT